MLCRVALALPVLLFSFAAAPAHAQSTGSAQVSAVDGNVDFQHGDDGTPEAVTVNTSLAPGDYLTTHDGRAEVQFDSNVMLRLSSNTQVRFDDIDTESRALVVDEGTIELRVVHDAATYPDIQTPSLTIDPIHAGAYRISVLDDDSTQVTVRAGRTYVAAGKFDQVLDPGSTFAASGAGDTTHFKTLDEIAADDFDSWNADRDRIADATPPGPVAQAPEPAQPEAPLPPPVQAPQPEPPSYQQLPSYAVPDNALPSYAVPEYAPSAYVIVAPAPVVFYPPYPYAPVFWPRFYAGWRWSGHPYYGRAALGYRSYRGGGYRR
ncbi:MAG TPA: FecR domain-containing protein [Candidatus Acidoferrales bacterium]|nr:FecR domain-containing protein [Candidatus Acidoferrales bacterium]